MQLICSAFKAVLHFNVFLIQGKIENIYFWGIILTIFPKHKLYKKEKMMK